MCQTLFLPVILLQVTETDCANSKKLQKKKDSLNKVIWPALFEGCVQMRAWEGVLPLTTQG